MKRRWKLMLPVAGIIGITVLISLMLYRSVIEREEERCWQMLGDAAESVKGEMCLKFEDEIAKLRMVADIMEQEDMLEEEQVGFLHLERFQETTIFTRIDVLYPNHMILMANGEQKELPERFSFEEFAEKGEQISARTTDFATGEECVFYSLPVVKNNETVAILMGVVKADGLSEIFVSSIYNGQSDCCIVDSSDGNFIMDSWHEELGNLYEYPDRKLLKGYESVDIKDEVRNQRTGVVAFESKTTGNPLYMYYTPLGMFDWQLEVFVQENSVFENLYYLKRMLLLAGVIEALMLIVYFCWNLIMMKQLQESKNEIEKQQELLLHLSYRDMLTSLYNRNKYIQTLEKCRERGVTDTGVAYIDLNGLKQLNDSKSHDEGDVYIQNAAAGIECVFQDRAYRIGGDEFVVLAWNTGEDEFMEKAEELKEEMKKRGVSISTGFVWKKHSDDIEAMLREAEQQMYREKEVYYQTHDRRSR